MSLAAKTVRIGINIGQPLVSAFQIDHFGRRFVKAGKLYLVMIWLQAG